MEINQFFLAGINYKKTDVAVRGQFAVHADQYAAILQNAAAAGVRELFILSTCNRTEIYGMAARPQDLIHLLCYYTAGSAESFQQLAYIKQGLDAAEHLFSVAAGLDSQILGDYEIVGQLRQAVKIAREYACIGTFFERLLNVVLQSSKVIKNETALSGGTVSVSFAAIQFLKEQVEAIKDKKIVLLGTGKIGSNTCKNLVDYLETTNVTLINRTCGKAEALAAALGLKAAPYENMAAEVAEADVVIVATNAETPVITRASLVNSGRKFLIDLSIPNNIEPDAASLPQVTLVNVDGLSRINDRTLEKRQAEVPRAKAIIAAYMNEFTEWYLMRRHVPVLKAVKQKLIDMHQCNLYLSVQPSVSNCIASCDSQQIQKVINAMALKMRQQHKPGCNYIEAINDFISSRVN